MKAIDFFKYVDLDFFPFFECDVCNFLHCKCRVCLIGDNLQKPSEIPAMEWRVVFAFCLKSVYTPRDPRAAWINVEI